VFKPLLAKYPDIVRLEHLGLIGNFQISALVENSGAIVWGCLPRFDSEPLFSRLLDHSAGGQLLVAPADGARGALSYLENTNILETIFTGADGSFRVIDFAPRFFREHGVFRPTMLCRIIEPLAGAPRIRVACEPRLGWSKQVPAEVRGSQEIHYEGFANPVRLSTDIPLSHIGGQPFPLTEKKHLVFSWGAPFEGTLERCEELLAQTRRYWSRWVKHSNIPPLYQKEVIRSALALKLHCFEDTGAIIASTTTSIPEAPGSGRTWDYRYCWLRDAYYVLNAFHRIGHFEERESFISYLLNITESTPDLKLAPLYRIDGTCDLDERILEQWPGYNGEVPVRVGNGAALHSQNDIFGEMVLALEPIFLDERFSAERSPATLQLIERLARKAISVVGSPDAGIWEYRTEWQPQTFSTLMCWAAADRMARIAGRYAPADKAEFEGASRRIHEQILQQSWNPKLDSFVATHNGSDLDAALLQMVPLRLLPPDDPRLIATVDAIGKQLSENGWLYRYRLDDGFGRPTVAFIICTFWLIEALAWIGRATEAKRLMDQVHAAMSPLGLLSEDYDTTNKRLWGNFPQAYSHVGLIHAAFAASPRWTDIL
jgi:GH15 family glucan-1,4-alpha-glucosidase